MCNHTIAENFDANVFNEGTCICKAYMHIIYAPVYNRTTIRYVHGQPIETKKRSPLKAGSLKQPRWQGSVVLAAMTAS